MRRISTNFLRFVIAVIGAGVLALCVFALPALWKGGSEDYPALSHIFLLIMVGMYATAVPFFIALWKTFGLLGLIDRNEAFSNASVKILRAIKYCAAIIAVLYYAGVPLLFPIADADDAPGLIVIGFVFACAPAAVATFAAVLQRLLQDAVAMKAENDLTV